MNTHPTTTREMCHRCNSVSAVGFGVPDDVWREVAGQWAVFVLCLACFAALGDEKHIEWDHRIEFFPVSYATHHATREDRS